MGIRQSAFRFLTPLDAVIRNSASAGWLNLSAITRSTCTAPSPPMHFPRILSGRSQYTQHLPPWSGSLWLGAAALCLIDHFYCSTLHNKDTIRAAPSYAAATQRILALMVEFCLMAANISVIFHVVRMVILSDNQMLTILHLVPHARIPQNAPEPQHVLLLCPCIRALNYYGY